MAEKAKIKSKRGGKRTGSGRQAMYDVPAKYIWTLVPVEHESDFRKKVADIVKPWISINFSEAKAKKSLPKKPLKNPKNRDF